MDTTAEDNTAANKNFENPFAQVMCNNWVNTNYSLHQSSSNPDFSNIQVHYLPYEEATTSKQTNQTISDSVTLVPDEDLFSLLKSWKLEDVYPTLQAQKISIDVLKKMKIHHIERLLQTFDIGTQILFEHELEKWRLSIECPLQINTPQSLNSLSDIIENSDIGALGPMRSFASSPASSSRMSPYPRSLSTEFQNQPQSDMDVNLAKILNDSNNGRKLCSYYEENRCFSEEQRTILICTIARYFDENDLTLPLSTSYKVEKEILERFPSEKLEFYRTSKRGRIYNKLSNLKSSTKTMKKLKSVLKDVTNEEEIKKTFVPEEDAELIRASLKHDNLSSEEMDHYWKACSRYRLKDILECKNTLEIFEKWPEYKLPQSPRLIDMDFKIKFENCPSILTSWVNVSTKILTFLNTKGTIGSKHIKTQLSVLEKEELNENSRDAIILWALHGFILPWQRVVSKSKEGHKNVTRFTIIDSQESFMIHCKSIEEVEEHIRFKKSKSEAIQPFVITIGESLAKITDIFVYFDSLKFPVKSFIRAVDILFKIYHLFNLEYPKASSTFWNFIQVYFFKLKSSEKFAKVNIIINELEK